jgi:hypothetical protein
MGVVRRKTYNGVLDIRAIQEALLFEVGVVAYY